MTIKKIYFIFYLEFLFLITQQNEKIITFYRITFINRIKKRDVLVFVSKEKLE